MIREIVKINEDLCNGCGICIPNCHEGALQVIDGKARLISELMCDGLGACLGHCPEGAIEIEKREVEEYAVHNGTSQAAGESSCGSGGGCPGSAPVSFDPHSFRMATPVPATTRQSELQQWPVQMHLINPDAAYFKGADLLVAADCAAFSYGNFHQEFIKGRKLVIACPKLDHGKEIYLEKLIRLITGARVNTITVVIMEVPCCGGLSQLVQMAVSQAGRKVPVKEVVIGIRGDLLAEEWV